jgi:glyceraldehyde 3-phosphate dehydrogenase
MIRVGINGLGRIGRAFLREAVLREDIEVVALNDLGDADTLVYLLKFDSVYGLFPGSVERVSEGISVNGKVIRVFQEKEPQNIPWGTASVDVVVEATGVFTTYKAAREHIKGGAKRVVMTAPAKDEPASDEAMILMGLNDKDFKGKVVTSNASCTTNAAAPLIAVLNEAFGVEKALLTTIHAYTASQSLVDGPKKDLREGRSAAINMVPTSTGAAIAVTEILTDLSGKFDGVSVRVPVPAGSLVDITLLLKREATVEEVNKALTKASGAREWQGLLAITHDPIVSTDIVGAKFASIADLSMTRSLGQLVKVMGWYDNEAGYTHTLVEHVIRLGKTI